MLEDRYLYRKILVSAIVMTLFLVIVWLVGEMLGYYWNAVQGMLAEVTAGQIRNNGTFNFGASSAIFCIMILSLLVFAAIASRTHRGEKFSFPFQVILIIPLFIYLCSAIFETQKLKEVGSAIFDVDRGIDFVVYIPFAACGYLLTLYLLLVMFVPASIFTRLISYLCVIVGIILYSAYAAFIVYSQMMSVLGTSFSKMTSALYLACFASDVVAYFFMLSVLMTWCAIKREERMPDDELPLTGRQRRYLKRKEKEMARLAKEYEAEEIIEDEILDDEVSEETVIEPEQEQEKEKSKEEPIEKDKEKAKEETKEISKEEQQEKPKEKAKEEPKEKAKEKPKEKVKEEPKEESKKELKEEQKEELIKELKEEQKEEKEEKPKEITKEKRKERRKERRKEKRKEKPKEEQQKIQKEPEQEPPKETIPEKQSDKQSDKQADEQPEKEKQSDLPDDPGFDPSEKPYFKITKTTAESVEIPDTVTIKEIDVNELINRKPVMKTAGEAVDKATEKAVDKVADNAIVKTGDNAIVKTSDKAADKVVEKAANKAPDNVDDKKNGKEKEAEKAKPEENEKSVVKEKNKNDTEITKGKNGIKTDKKPNKKDK